MRNTLLPHAFQPSRRSWLLAALASAASTAALGASANPPPDAPHPSECLSALAESYFNALLDADPFWASQLGIATPAQAARIAIEIAPSAREALARLHAGTRQALHRLERGALAGPAQTTYDLIDWVTEDQLDQLKYPDHLLPLDQRAFTVPFQLAAAADNGLSAFATAEDFEHHLARLRQLPAWCAQAVANLREGLRRGINQPAVILERLLPMVRALAPQDVSQSPYLAPLKALPAALPPAVQARLRQQYRDCVARELNPALARLAEVLARESLPRGRTSAGWSALPGGPAWYAQWVRTHTSTDLTPQQIHTLGLQDVQRLRERMAAVQKQYGHTGTLRAFLQWHAQRPEARPFTAEQQVLDAYAALNRRITAQLPTLFNSLPKARLEIRPEPELTRDTASDHYESPSLDGARPGVFYAVIPDPTAYATATMASLFLHEGQPGHHLQVAVAQELPLPKLQRFYFHTAYGEGWALYAETLGYPMGLYDDPDAHLGHLSMAMMRAVRLVVDTGLHALGWTRQQAFDYFQEQTGFTDTATRIQIERYMAAPGQALSYAIGRMTMERLRDEARQALGPRFSLPAFHDQLLDGGALPLSVLEAKLKRWLGDQARA